MPTDRDKEAIVILTLPQIPPANFAINFIGAFATLAGERFLMRWLLAGYKLEQKRFGSADEFYQKYATTYNGDPEFEHKPIDSSFAATFLNLYQTFESHQLYSLIHPTDAVRNRDHLSRGVFHELTQGMNAPIVSKYIYELGVNDENLISRAREIINTMDDTIARAVHE